MTDEATERAEYRGEALAARGFVGGALMGLANLVPGISGGTMLLAAGVYPQFINGVAEVSTFRFRAKSVLLLACIVSAAVVAILALAGPVGTLVVNHRWIMYSIFIGLTLGGVPILYRMVKPLDWVVIVAAIVGLAVMVAMACFESAGASAAAGDGHPYGMYFLAGLAGASAMVLPGVSGGYLLLILGQYVTILMAVAALKEGLQARDFGAIAQTGHIIVPVGLGVLIGIVVVSNVVKIFLEKFERATVGALLGLLLGAVVGLWPFQAGVAPEPDKVFRGDRVVLVEGELRMERTGRVIEAADYPTAVFAPTVVQIAGALGLIVLGFAASTAVAHLGGARNNNGLQD